uniref:Spen paralogue and orthologue SPOC C-terminal domain-containing protein n=1 Tax=Timspurckia oligopyrenoides TaxID=708627 RepID=A0A7S1ET23_9RHOD|mmetsp:Transcript_5773/g.10199  ORF Transcript_5773/g.10199 Transcript_5773/m.10199 type:complete len:724 (+) Transcript_5773:215-2386(+)
MDDNQNNDETVGGDENRNSERFGGENRVEQSRRKNGGDRNDRERSLSPVRHHDRNIESGGEMRAGAGSQNKSPGNRSGGRSRRNWKERKRNRNNDRSERNDEKRMRMDRRDDQRSRKNQRSQSPTGSSRFNRDNDHRNQREKRMRYNNRRDRSPNRERLSRDDRRMDARSMSGSERDPYEHRSVLSPGRRNSERYHPSEELGRRFERNLDERDNESGRGGEMDITRDRDSQEYYRRDNNYRARRDISPGRSERSDVPHSQDNKQRYRDNSNTNHGRRDRYDSPWESRRQQRDSRDSPSRNRRRGHESAVNERDRERMRDGSPPPRSLDRPAFVQERRSELPAWVKKKRKMVYERLDKALSFTEIEAMDINAVDDLPGILDEAKRVKRRTYHDFRDEVWKMKRQCRSDNPRRIAENVENIIMQFFRAEVEKADARRRPQRNRSDSQRNNNRQRRSPSPRRVGRNNAEDSERGRKESRIAEEAKALDAKTTVVSSSPFTPSPANEDGDRAASKDSIQLDPESQLAFESIKSRLTRLRPKITDGTDENDDGFYLNDVGAAMELLQVQKMGTQTLVWSGFLTTGLQGMTRLNAVGFLVSTPSGEVEARRAFEKVPEDVSVELFTSMKQARANVGRKSDLMIICPRGSLSDSDRRNASEFRSLVQNLTIREKFGVGVWSEKQKLLYLMPPCEQTMLALELPIGVCTYENALLATVVTPSSPIITTPTQ